uniref:Uncharacterized protein n=1 Tax=Cacopsylla melanoneura TaxID=428564 RepID=A0A8D8VRV8_9HEMI
MHVLAFWLNGSCSPCIHTYILYFLLKRRFFFFDLSYNLIKWNPWMIIHIAVSAGKKKKRRSKNKRKPRVWCKDWLRKRNQFSHVNLLDELKFAPKDWHNFLRMDEETYSELLALVTPLIIKEDTKMRAAIPPHEKFTTCLRFLATGRSYADLKYSALISPQALSYMVPETCKAIYKVLSKEYMKVRRKK